jgi:hypothetical protein
MPTSKPAVKIGVVVHGPEVVDSGFALRVLNYLEKFGMVNAVLGGTMGRLAIMDAGLESIIKISPKRRPSQSIGYLLPGSDIIVLLNQAKTRETGRPCIKSLHTRAPGRSSISTVGRSSLRGRLRAGRRKRLLKLQRGI